MNRFLGAKLVGVTPGDGGIGLDDLPAAIENGTIKTLVAWGEDPAEIEGLAGVLDKLETLILVHPTKGPGVEKAHVALPGCTTFEKDGTLVNIEGRVQRIRPAVTPQGRSRVDWQILRDLLALLGEDAKLVSARSVFKRVAEAVPAFAGMTYKTIGELGLPVAEGAPETV